MARYLKVSGVLFVQVTDAANATYGIRQPLISVVKAAEAGMRNALGDMEMDECFREKDKLNKAVMQTLVETTGAWGLEAKRYEVTDIDAAPEIKAAMNLQAAAER
jgi:regulator of protease activity HflC (stomatin/prohibitin superfamily)